MTRVYLIRHGQTEWNAEGRWQGQLDVPLSANGYAQAQALAEHLANVGLCAVYASDLGRAAETGRVIAEASGASLSLDPRLRELHLGIFQGLTYSEIRERYPDDEEQMKLNYMDHVLEQGESRRVLQARALAAWKDILAQAPCDSIAIVSHGGTIRLLLLAVLRPEMNQPVMTMPIGNTSCTLLDVADDGSVQMLDAANQAHLERQAPDSGEGRL